MKAQIRWYLLACSLLAAQVAGEAARRSTRYVLVMAEPPVLEAERTMARAAVAGHRLKLRSAQSAAREALAAMRIGVAVHGSSTGVLNAIFVSAPAGSEAELARIPGVARVVEDAPIRLAAVRAMDLHRVSEAWQNVGGEANAGAGVKIAVLDTGIDQEHASFQDSALAAPAGFPRCQERDCRFTNSKVIVARSYVDRLVYNFAGDTRPDDESARDRKGHGTAVAMVAAGVRHQSPLGTISGVAPKAFLGNYKIFGSPGVNDGTYTSAVVPALEDAIADGMDIAVLSFGRPAEWAPLDEGSRCELPAGRPCDPLAAAVETAARRMLVVVAAGNDGDIGTHSAFALNSVHSPANAPSALAVGATTNAQRYRIAVTVAGEGVPPALAPIQALFGEGNRLAAPLRAPLRDAAAILDDGLACAPLPAGSLAGAIAIVQRGPAANSCTYATKVIHAQRAGAVAVLVEQRDGADALLLMGGLREAGIPALMIGSSAGKALREFLRNNGGREAVIAASPSAFPFEQDFAAFFSSLGPSIDNGAIKPEVAAVGYPMYMATQRFDPNGEMYSPDGYVAAQGTSFAAPIAAGVAALFKQRNQNATPALMKSAVVNTATADVDDVDERDRVVEASVHAVGAGKVNAPGAARTTLGVNESVVSFGYLFSTSLPVARTLTVVNQGNAQASVRLQVEGANNASARVVLDATSFNLAAGATRPVAVRLEGARPAPGLYSGIVSVTGGAVPLRVPYSFLVGDGTPFNIVPLRGFAFTGETGTALRLFFKVMDRYGVPVTGARVEWPADRIRGGGRIDAAFGNTDGLGIHEARVILGSQVGEQSFVARAAGSLEVPFSGRALRAPAIATDGAVNAASNQVGRGVAPGSYIAIYGQALSEVFKIASTASLPLSLANVSIGFDTPSGRSYPGRLYFVSEGQINLQVPWELQGLNGAQIKVSIGDISSGLYALPLNEHSPALFEIPDPGGSVVAAALDAQFQLVTTANPLQRGQSGQLYGNGLGPVTNQPATGEPSPAGPLAETRTTPTVTIGGRPAQVLFSGLTPGSVGLYQINIIPAADTPTGLQPVVVTIGGIASKPVNIAIR
ncbi:MAG: S8 family serine peptidase [Bryobacterales bacterium]|nr:S8 family serine peptidase [Bryobacterales bacterium]